MAAFYNLGVCTVPRVIYSTKRSAYSLIVNVVFILDISLKQFITTESTLCPYFSFINYCQTLLPTLFQILHLTVLSYLNFSGGNR